jgi:hypothetical protein
MKPASTCLPHTFHIPVMGTGFTIDTPLRIAKYGISSVISLVDDVFVEQMRKFHSEKDGASYQPIGNREPDARALRITAYLDLVDGIVKRQMKELQESPFEAGSQITRYFELLPDTPLKRKYRNMLAADNPTEKQQLQDELRSQATPGDIDVNIMTKLDRDRYSGKEKLAPEFADALSALRGFAKSTLSSSIVLSAGMNRRLYSYIANFKDFFADKSGAFKKKIILKVSDFRSADVQGRFLAKKGLWVSEYRIESGLNCGGHAFATKGYLMGPILEEFKRKKGELVEGILAAYNKAMTSLERPTFQSPPNVRITVQGGIGTAEENEMLLKHYDVDRTGWGTPFLFVPEVSNVDDEHLTKLAETSDENVFLSGSSPLGVPFWNLRNSASEMGRRQRIEQGKPGSPCPKGYLATNTEFSNTPICPASRAYQKQKIAELQAATDIPLSQLETVVEGVLNMSCICHELSGGATRKHDIDPSINTAICCGPNIVNFSRVASLEEMVEHIYGRISLLTSAYRSHMFINELVLYVKHLRKEKENCALGHITNTPKYFREFKENLLSGIEYYKNLAEHFVEEKRAKFLEELQELREEIECIPMESPIPA